MPRRSARLAARRMGGLAALGAVAIVVPGAALANDAGSVTHSSGTVSATLAWDKAEFGIANPRLYVVRDGIRYDITIEDVCGDGCMVFPDDSATKPGQSAVKVADLDRDGEPEVLVDTYSGGAHCCVTARLLTWDGTGYVPKDIEYRDVGYELRDLDGDGRPELAGLDPRFSGAFTFFAASGFPAQVLQVDHGKVADVTKQFPAYVKADLDRQRKDLRRLKRRDDIRGILAAYVADLCSLQQGAKADQELDRQIARKRVTKGYKKLLLRRLHAWGYR